MQPDVGAQSVSLRRKGPRASREPAVGRLPEGPLLRPSLKIGPIPYGPRFKPDHRRGKVLALCPLERLSLRGAQHLTELPWPHELVLGFPLRRLIGHHTSSLFV